MLMVRTFKTLAEIGDFESPADLSDVEVAESLSGTEDGNGGRRVVNKKLTTGNTGMTVNLNIQLQIPATDKADIYVSFFAAMKKHLLS